MISEFTAFPDMDTCLRSGGKHWSGADVKPAPIKQIGAYGHATVKQTRDGTCVGSENWRWGTISDFTSFPDMESCLRQFGKPATASAEPAPEASSPDYGGAPVKRTRDGICLAPDHPQWSAVSNYGAFPDLESCLSNAAVPSSTAKSSQLSSGPGVGVVKLSRNGICHDPSSPYYGQTKNFTAYRTLKECLNSGGRLPK